ncbi:MAG TPA: NADPH:quinone reductase, partial [Thermodesulfobacteriota bacterium]|nr:NADPH:quinone reductase [Thermodesulfobacteriota bacterium]
MKAIRVHEFGEPEVMKLEDVPDPVPGPGEIVVSIEAAGVNPVETYIRSGSYARKPALPFTPGSDGAGRVESVGEGVDRFRRGDRVFLTGSLTGTYAEKALCAQSQVHLLPSGISPAQGAAVHTPYFAAYRALLHKGKALPGETILVHGATGGVGIAAVQLARAHGMQVVGTGGTEKGRRLISEQGAGRVLDHRSPGYLKEAHAQTHGRGFDVIIELLANVNLQNDLEVLARNGRVVIVGSRGTVEINPRDAMMRDAVISGMLLNNASEEERARIASAVVAGLENGTLRPIVGLEIPLREAARAHREIMEPGAFGKIVLLT